MASIPIYYDTVYRLKCDNNIHFTKDFKMCFNYKKQSQKKIVLNGHQKGIWLNSKAFIKAKDFVELSEPIPKYEFMEDSWLSALSTRS